MRVLILAAGRGSRMHAFTEDRPKGLIELAGQPLLERQIAALRQGGCSEVAIVTGYRGNQLKPYADRVFDNARWAETNMVRSLCCADKWLNQSDTLVSYADIVVSSATVAALAHSPADLAISYDPEWLSLWSARFADPLADAESFRRSEDGRLLEIGARVSDASRIQGQYMGLLRISPRGWERISSYVDGLPVGRADHLDMTALLSALVQEGTPVYTVPAAGQWIEVDSGEDLILYEHMMADGRLRLG